MKEKATQMNGCYSSSSSAVVLLPEFGFGFDLTIRAVQKDLSQSLVDSQSLETKFQNLSLDLE